MILSAYNTALVIPRYTGLKVDIHGIGVASLLIFTVVLGWVAKGLTGRSLIRWAESLALSNPLIRSLYSGTHEFK